MYNGVPLSSKKLSISLLEGIIVPEDAISCSKKVMVKGSRIRVSQYLKHVEVIARK